LPHSFNTVQPARGPRTPVIQFANVLLPRKYKFMNAENPANRSRARLLLAVLGLGTTAGAAWVFSRELSSQGASTISYFVLLLLFVVLFFWVALSFWIATAGFVRRLLSKQATCLVAPPAPRDLAIATRSAILMPVYNESPHRVFAGVRAIYESLQETGQGAAFDFFVLSDTTDPDIWLAEELTWARLNLALAGSSRLYYRHRAKNVARKSGNIADFCEQWGAAYRYMLVLDADSVMSGETIVELARRMEQDPEIGILQAPPVPVNRHSLFARCQQFAAAVYGPIFLEGFAWWSGIDGNYWGHNAILRLDAFVRACGLPKLPGDGPLGGEILSHDFVEAALIRRAGFKVCLANDLEGSYEECPPTLIDFAQRDQRWCQGNLQHIRLVFSAGIHPISRLHLGMGAMSYLASPLWLLSLVLSFLAATLPHSSGEQAGGQAGASAPDRWALGLFGVTLLLLLLPKLWSYIVLLRDPRRLAECGGAAKVAGSVLLETAVSMLVAPILMAFHSTFVVTTLLGRRVHWTAQQRGENGQDLFAAAAAHWKQTALALVALLVTWMFAGAMLVWLSPVFAGLLLAIPLSILLASVPLGRALERRGLLQIPQETLAPTVLERHRHFLALAPAKELADSRSMFRRMLTDPALLALHCCILETTKTCLAAAPRAIVAAQRQLLAGGPLRVSADNRKAILSDPAALKALHLFVWSTQAASPSAKA
jgi:membrane glycosyltransferase